MYPFFHSFTLSLILYFFILLLSLEMNRAYKNDTLMDHVSILIEEREEGRGDVSRGEVSRGEVR